MPARQSLIGVQKRRLRATSRLGRLIQRLVNPIFYGSGAAYYSVPYYDGKLICPNSFVCALSRPSIWEFESRQYLVNHVQPGDIAVDVGACFGLYTYLFSKLVGHSGQVYAFEPDPAMFRLLQHNIRINHLENVILSSSAVSDTNGEADFYLSTAGASSLEAQFGLRSVCRVQVLTIDSLDLKRLDWLKADVEGTEHLVLRGAKNTLQRLNTRLLVEFIPRFGNTDNLLSELTDYELLGLDHNLLCLPKRTESHFIREL